MALLDSVSHAKYKCGCVQIGAEERDLAAHKPATWAKLTFPPSLVELPFLWEMCSKFDVVLSIASAQVTQDGGEAVVLLSGKGPQVEAALGYLKNLGVDAEDAEEPQGWSAQSNGR